MRSKSWTILGAVATVSVSAAALIADSSEAAPASSDGDSSAAGAPLTIEEARGRARLLHVTYEATLHTIHRRYFDEDERHPTPARSLEEVFKEVDAATGTSTRWIAVNTPAMNVDHEPRDDFEKQAVATLASGELEFERVENGFYRRAGSVELVASCLKCYVSGLTKQIKTKRTAGFVVSLPVGGD